MPATVQLVGLDFGTTTSGAVVASARLAQSSVAGRVELGDVRECYRSELVFTPLQDDGSLDVPRLEECLDAWLAAAGVHAEQVFGGGALLTGLTARKANAAALTGLVRRRLGDALVATADDPCLESWLAFLGSSAGLSRAHPELFVLSLDVGGGTTNLALGRSGEVLRTGCLLVGARHVRVEPGTYRVVGLSPQAEALFARLAIRKGAGDTLSEAEIKAVLDFYVGLLEAAVAGRAAAFQDPVARLHQQVPFGLPAEAVGAVVTLSGGVGELVYGHLDGRPWPPTTCFGDLGIDLARRLVESPLWAEHLRAGRPASAGRATVYGLLRHSTEVSGSTLFLPRPDLLPLPDVPVLGNLSSAMTDAQVQDVLARVRGSAHGGCLRVTLPGASAAAVRAFGRRLAGVLRESAFPAGRPLLLMLQENLGKVLGHYATDWGALPLDVVVLDEVTVRDAHFVHVGRPRGPVVPVSFYGLSEPGEPPCAS
jgi:ethanolamine utilization protein EutA